MVEAVSIHHSAVVGLVGFEKLRWHCSFVVKVGETTIGIFCSYIQDVLGSLFDFLNLFSDGVGHGKLL